MTDQIYDPKQGLTDFWRDTIPFIMEGQVMDVADPDQMGRCRIWLPSIDGETFTISELPWATYAPVFGGFTTEYPGGNGTIENDSHTAYGLWATPKVGATVYVFCVNGNPASRAYFASSTRLHRNRSLPAGRNTDFNGKAGPWGDAGDGTGNLNPVQPSYDNLRTQFNNNVSASEAITRGVYERNVAQAKIDKDGTEGYSSNPADSSYLDCQTLCWVSPGRHAIIFQDDPRFARFRIKTGEGHQIILDDANERIYVSTAKGESWIEMDIDGHINIFGGNSVSVRSGADLNFFADGNINMEAGAGVNIKADTADIRMAATGGIHAQANGPMALAACGSLDIDGEQTVNITAAGAMNVHAKSTLNLTADSSLDIKTGGSAKLGTGTLDIVGSKITITGTTAINGPAAAHPAAATDAGCPTPPIGPTVVPGFEPWTRPVAKSRNKYWKA